MQTWITIMLIKVRSNQQQQQQQPRKKEKDFYQGIAKINKN